MKTIEQSIQFIKKNIRSILGFELSYRLICMAIILPILSALFHFSIKLSGFEYLSEDRLFTYLTKPSTIVIILFVVFALSVITLFEIFCLLPAYHASYHQKNISLTAMYQHGLFVLKKSLHLKNLPLMLHALILLPMMNLSILSGYISSWIIPDFVLYFIHSKKMIFQIFCILFIGLLLISIRFCLVLHCYCLEEGDYRHSLKKALQLTKKHYFSTIFYLLFWNLILVIVLTLAILICFFLYAIFVRIFLPYAFHYTSLMYHFSIILTVMFDLYFFFSIPFSFSVLSSIYYRQIKKEQLPVPAYIPEGGSLFSWVSRRVFLLILLLASLFNIFYFRLISSSDFFWNQNIISRPAITAHRGDSKKMPENTLSAFALAIEEGADVLELDVQYSLDREIIVFHDATLMRLCGEKIDVGLLLYDTLLTYDIAKKKQNIDTALLDSEMWEKWKDVGITEHSAYHSIPTLEQVLSFCRGRVDLNIEIKSSPYNEGIEKEIVSLLEEYDYVDHCVIVAKDAEHLKKIKAINNDIKTIYLLSVAYGSYSNLDYIDGVSIRSSFLTRALVHDIHDHGKAIYAWTVNAEEEMHRMYSLGVDALITDYPSRAIDSYLTHTMNPSLYTWLRQIINAWK